MIPQHKTFTIKLATSVSLTHNIFKTEVCVLLQQTIELNVVQKSKNHCGANNTHFS
jgi:hypothetical protein